MFLDEWGSSALHLLAEASGALGGESGKGGGLGVPRGGTGQPSGSFPAWRVLVTVRDRVGTEFRLPASPQASIASTTGICMCTWVLGPHNSKDILGGKPRI